MDKFVEDNIVLNPILHVEVDFAILRGLGAMWEAVRMQNGFASYFAWCKMGKFRWPFQPETVINIAQLCIRKEVPVMVWSRRFDSYGVGRQPIYHGVDAVCSRWFCIAGICCTFYVRNINISTYVEHTTAAGLDFS